MSCPSGTFNCSTTDTPQCIPDGSTCCGDGYCNSGTFCYNDLGCCTDGTTGCGNTSCCASGHICCVGVLLKCHLSIK